MNGRRKGERRVDFLMRAHDAEGLKRFGPKQWNKANIGWGSSETSICSKVYGAKVLGDKSTQVETFQTDLTKDGNAVAHTLRLVAMLLGVLILAGCVRYETVPTDELVKKWTWERVVVSKKESR